VTRPSDAEPQDETTPDVAGSGGSAPVAATPAAGQVDDAAGHGPARAHAAAALLVPAAALACGLAAGLLVTPRAPGWLAPYLPVAVIAALDALAGGLRAACEKVFDERVFVASFGTNILVAVTLVALGVRLGVDGALTTAVLIVLGVRIFTNLTALRRHVLGA
jgi:small basic protein